MFFCWLLFRAKFDCNFIQFYVPCILCGISLYELCVRESAKTQDTLKIKEVFKGSSRVAFLRSEAYAQHMIGIQRVITDGDNWFSLVSRG